MFVEIAQREVSHSGTKSFPRTTQAIMLASLLFLESYVRLVNEQGIQLTPVPRAFDVRPATVPTSFLLLVTLKRTC